jgi:hypothetical protein
MLALLLAAYGVSQFVPYSFGGSALSCAVANGSFSSLKTKVENFIADNGDYFGRVTNFLLRSDFKIRNAGFDTATMQRQKTSQIYLYLRSCLPPTTRT